MRNQKKKPHRHIFPLFLAKGAFDSYCCNRDPPYIKSLEKARIEIVLCNHARKNNNNLLIFYIYIDFFFAL